MASDPKLNKDFQNALDNADTQMDRRAKDIASAYTEYDEMKAYKAYLEALEVESRVTANTRATVKTVVTKADGTEDTVDIPISNLVPKQSEFEQARRRTLVKLNAKKSRQGGGGLQHI